MEEMSVGALITVIYTVPFAEAHAANRSLWHHHVCELTAAELHVLAEVAPLDVLVVELVDFFEQKVAGFQAEEEVNGPLGI